MICFNCQENTDGKMYRWYHADQEDLVSVDTVAQHPFKRKHSRGCDGSRRSTVVKETTCAEYIISEASLLRSDASEAVSSVSGRC